MQKEMRRESERNELKASCMGHESDHGGLDSSQNSIRLYQIERFPDRELHVIGEERGRA